MAVPVALILTALQLDKFKSSIKDDSLDFETHIYFDDAFVNDSACQTGKKKRLVNSYVDYLLQAIEEVFRVFTKNKKDILCHMSTQAIMSTPYGGRLHYKLPGGNSLYVHLKDKTKIRNKKRWSEKEKSNTYVLALDGDTDFQPTALMFLMDRLKMYPEVGAVSGRIYPAGLGPVIWYQKFEYAVCHWLQKPSEHVFGCVLCSPGCFSLYRASALMDDNVLKKFSKKAERASEYVQCDQGEDRWLCTLLLQQGWRVEYNAAANAYTNAPQDLQEFYNQRKRWDPSTMANTLDLLHSAKETVKKNPSISCLFILYQQVKMVSSILTPTSVCLMIAGSLSFLFHWDSVTSIVVAIIPPACYMGVCFGTKHKTQITVALVLSVCYALLMMATFFSIIGDIVKQQTFMTPSGLFLIAMGVLYITVALLHPREFFLLIYGLVYIIFVPSGYLLLTIYSLVNLHDVSWGTRESAVPTDIKDGKSQSRVRCQKTCRCLWWDIEVLVHDNKCEEKEKNKNTTKDEKLPKDFQSEKTDKNTEEEDSCTYEESWISQLKQKTHHNIFKQKEMEMVNNNEEILFWEGVIKTYLEPIHVDKEKQAEIQKDLKSLRNKVTLIFFTINLLWIVGTCFLEISGLTISIVLPNIYVNGTISPSGELHIEPIGLMFLLSFAALLILQFGALLYHR
ncbi:chitin synthase chs-2-like [Hyperolius riggenbachi]|uniref:chitin synthase chs-2-like n=1 Tax=Hyperolius riggenbachi TaxID=752182 RepID=UPI0035A2A396